MVGESPARMIWGDEEAEEGDERWGIFTPSPSSGGLYSTEAARSKIYTLLYGLGDRLVVG